MPKKKEETKMDYKEMTVNELLDIYNKKYEQAKADEDAVKAAKLYMTIREIRQIVEGK